MIFKTSATSVTTRSRSIHIDCHGVRFQFRLMLCLGAGFANTGIYGASTGYELGVASNVRPYPTAQRARQSRTIMLTWSLPNPPTRTALTLPAGPRADSENDPSASAFRRPPFFRTEARPPDGRPGQRLGT